MTTTARPQCVLCKHWRDGLMGTGTCDAFPDEIPFDVFSGQTSHVKPIPGDNGVTFEKTDDPGRITAFG